MSLAVWENKWDGKIVKSITIQKNYKNKEGKWCSTRNFRLNDIPDLQMILRQCFDWLKSKKPEEK